MSSESANARHLLTQDRQPRLGRTAGPIIVGLRSFIANNRVAEAAV
jgi:hypothetical protein